jgi:hypothetical protein
MKDGVCDDKELKLVAVLPSADPVAASGPGQSVEGVDGCVRY